MKVPVEQHNVNLLEPDSLSIVSALDPLAWTL